MMQEEFDRSVIEGATQDVVKSLWPQICQWPRKVRLQIVGIVHRTVETEYRKMHVVQAN